MENSYDLIIDLTATPLYEYAQGDLILYNGVWWEVVYNVPGKLHVKFVKYNWWELSRSLYHRAMASIKAFIHSYS